MSFNYKNKGEVIWSIIKKALNKKYFWLFTVKLTKPNINPLLFLIVYIVLSFIFRTRTADEMKVMLYMEGPC